MTRRAVIVLLAPVPWHPPGVDPDAWRSALAEDVIDLVATLAHVEAAIAAPPEARALARALAWPGMPVYDVPDATVGPALAAAAADGFDQAAVLASDAPDVPGLVIGKVLRPLTSRPVAVAPAERGPGLFALAAALPSPAWLPPIDLDAADPARRLRAAAPSPDQVVGVPGWRRLRGPDDLATLDPSLEGWDATRLLLSAPG